MTFTPLPRTTGRIAYRFASTNVLWGIEDWSVTTDADGNMTLEVHCEMAHDGKNVVRATTLSVDQDFQPLDAFVRIWNQGHCTGTGWFRFNEGLAECEAWTQEKGRITQREDYRSPLRGFGVHALIGDGWLAAPCDLSQGAGTDFYFGKNLIHSLDHLGATGPEIETTTSGLRYKGQEQVTVPAGTFECDRFEIVGIVNDHPPYDFWITTGGLRLYVKGTVAGYMDSVFLLEELCE